MEDTPPAAVASTSATEYDEEPDADDQLEAEVDKLQEELKDMARKISTYRSAFPDQLRSGLAALLAAQRPQFPDSEPASPNRVAQDAGSHGEGVRAAEEDEETSERIRLLKEKISSNVSAMPQVLKRMNDCISRIDKLSSSAEVIHPAFKRKKS